MTMNSTPLFNHGSSLIVQICKVWDSLVCCKERTCYTSNVWKILNDNETCIVSWFIVYVCDQLVGRPVTYRKWEQTDELNQMANLVTNWRQAQKINRLWLYWRYHYICKRMDVLYTYKVPGFVQNNLLCW